MHREADDAHATRALDGSAKGGADPTGRHLGDLLLHPVAIGALALMVFNDHVAKERWPSGLTGKLSDLAGLVFFPLLLVSIAEVVLWVFRRDRWALGRGALAVAIAVTALGFIAIKTWGPAGDAYRVANGVTRWPLDAISSLFRGDGFPPVGKVGLVEDRSDLLAVAALVVPWWIGSKRLGRRS